MHVIRDPLVECTHRGHAAVWRHGDGLVTGWGDVTGRILPRSAMKMMQALPLVESGAARAAGLSDIRLALSCASHRGAAIHTDTVTSWLADLGLSEPDLRCGPQMPSDEAALHAMIRAHGAPDQRHNNCSGKHTGFLTLSKHLGGGPEYLEIDHPVQQAITHRGRGADGGDLRQLRHRRLFRSELRAVTGRLRARASRPSRPPGTSAARVALPCHGSCPR